MIDVDNIIKLFLKMGYSIRKTTYIDGIKVSTMTHQNRKLVTISSTRYITIGDVESQFYFDERSNELELGWKLCQSTQI